MQSVQCGRHPPEDFDGKRKLVEPEAQAGGKVSDERSVERVALGFASKTSCVPCRSAGNPGPRSPSRTGRAPVAERLFQGRELSTATGDSARPSSASASDARASSAPLRRSRSLRAAASWTSARPANCAQRGSCGRKVPTSARRTVNPGGGTHESVDRDADRLQKRDQRAVMFARVTDAAAGQDRANVSHGADP